MKGNELRGIRHVRISWPQRNLRCLAVRERNLNMAGRAEPRETGRRKVAISAIVLLTVMVLVSMLVGCCWILLFPNDGFRFPLDSCHSFPHSIFFAFSLPWKTLYIHQWFQEHYFTSGFHSKFQESKYSLVSAYSSSLFLHLSEMSHDIKKRIIQS